MLNFIRAVRETLQILGPERHGRWLVLVVLALAVTAFEAVGAVLIYTLLALISGGSADISLPLLGSLSARAPQTSLRSIQLSVAALVAIFFLIRSGVIVGQAYIQARLVYNAGARLANHLIRGYLALPYLEHTRMNSAELVRNAFDSVQSLITKVMKPAVEAVAEMVLVAGLTCVLLVVAPQATLIAITVLAPLVWLLQSVIQPRLKQLGRRSQESRRSALQAMQQALGGLRDIRLLGREEEFAAMFAHQRRIMSRTEYLKHSLSEIPRTLIETGLVLVIVVVFTVAVVGGTEQGSVLATLGIFAYAGLRLQPSLRKIVQGLNHIRFGTAIIEDLLRDRRRVDAVLEARRNRPDLRVEQRRLQHSIELRNVHFSYAPDGVPALRDVNLTIRRGEFIGICGPTGGGKSTLVDLIAGLLQPTKGEVLIDGRPMGGFPTWWYAQLGVVSQSVYLLDDTLRRNIAFGSPEEEIDEALLHASIERAQLREVVESLPAGLETVLGERGIRLSGGQRQRVAVARALYREPSVIIFDEGTSALDSATEAALVAAIDELKVGGTLISVAHRISTVHHADRIIVVEGGRILMEDTYDGLMQRSELFRTLAR